MEFANHPLHRRRRIHMHGRFNLVLLWTMALGLRDCLPPDANAHLFRGNGKPMTIGTGFPARIARRPPEPPWLL